MENEAATKRLKEKVAIITGGASGIGAATCKLFVEQGAYVVIGDIQDGLGGELAEQLGANACYRHCDVAREGEVEGLVACAVEKHGHVDIMFCNAGISVASNVTASICEMAMVYFQHTMDVNVKGVVHGIKHAARAMQGSRRGGSIICNASAVTQLAQGHSHAYGISKHAVVGAMRSAASELSKFGIRVNAISPFIVDTPLAASVAQQVRPDIVLSHLLPASFPLLGTHLTALDIAHAALFFASHDSRFISGHNLVVDGGFSISKTLQLPNPSKG